MPLRVLLALATAVVAVSFSSIFIRASDAPALALSFYRLAMAVPVTVLLRGFRRSGARSGTEGPLAAGGAASAAETGQTTRDLALMAASGLCLAAHFAAWIASLRYTTVASSVVLVSSHPLLVAAASRVIHDEALPRPAYAWAGLTLLGTALVGGGDLALGGPAAYGDMLALLGALSLAGYMLIGRRLRLRLDNVTYTAWVYAFAAAALALAASASGVPLWPYPAREWAIFLALALVPTLLGHSLFNWALAHVPATAVSLSNLGEPLGATVLAWLLLGEVPTAAEAAGGAAILLGLAGFLGALGRSGRELPATAAPKPSSPAGRTPSR